MTQLSVMEKMKLILEPKKAGIKARLFVSREDGITIYDSVQNQTTTSVSALISGVWQASEALMGIANPSSNVMEFRFAFDTSSQGVYLFPLTIGGKRYFLGALYQDCVNPGQLKRQVSMIKEEMDRLFQDEQVAPKTNPSVSREGYLFKEITDEEMDRLFSVGGI